MAADVTRNTCELEATRALVSRLARHPDRAELWTDLHTACRTWPVRNVAFLALARVGAANACFGAQGALVGSAARAATSCLRQLVALDGWSSQPDDEALVIPVDESGLASHATHILQAPPPVRQVQALALACAALERGRQARVSGTEPPLTLWNAFVRLGVAVRSIADTETLLPALAALAASDPSVFAAAAKATGTASALARATARLLESENAHIVTLALAVLSGLVGTDAHIVPKLFAPENRAEVLRACQSTCLKGDLLDIVCATRAVLLAAGPDRQSSRASADVLLHAAASAAAAARIDAVYAITSRVARAAVKPTLPAVSALADALNVHAHPQNRSDAVKLAEVLSQLSMAGVSQTSTAVSSWLRAHACPGGFATQDDDVARAGAAAIAVLRFNNVSPPSAALFWDWRSFASVAPSTAACALCLEWARWVRSGAEVSASDGSRGQREPNYSDASTSRPRAPVQKGFLSGSACRADKPQSSSHALQRSSSAGAALRAGLPMRPGIAEVAIECDVLPDSPAQRMADEDDMPVNMQDIRQHPTSLPLQEIAAALSGPLARALRGELGSHSVIEALDTLVDAPPDVRSAVASAISSSAMALHNSHPHELCSRCHEGDVTNVRSTHVADLTRHRRRLEEIEALCTQRVAAAERLAASAEERLALRERALASAMTSADSVCRERDVLLEQLREEREGRVADRRRQKRDQHVMYRRVALLAHALQALQARAASCAADAASLAREQSDAIWRAHVQRCSNDKADEVKRDFQRAQIDFAKERDQQQAALRDAREKLAEEREAHGLALAHAQQEYDAALAGVRVEFSDQLSREKELRKECEARNVELTASLQSLRDTLRAIGSMAGAGGQPLQEPRG